MKILMWLLMTFFYTVTGIVVLAVGMLLTFAFASAITILIVHANLITTGIVVLVVFAGAFIGQIIKKAIEQ